jgi:hypothetical protein
MPIPLPPSTQRDNWTVKVEDIEDELGPLIAGAQGESTGLFPLDNKSRIIGSWIIEETLIIYEFLGLLDTDLAIADKYTNSDQVMLHQCIMYRVCARIMRRAQVNRKVGKSFSQPTYNDQMERYFADSERYGLYLREKYYPIVSIRDVDYPYIVADEYRSESEIDEEDP